MGVALHTETKEKLILYKALHDVPDLKEEYGEEPVFARPYDMFVGSVIVGGEKVKRFISLD